MKIGSQIKAKRIEQGLIQKDLADRLGLRSNATVCMWENGERTPSAAMLPKIAAALNCTIDELFADTDECDKGDKTDEQD